ncbi:unnamed protein product [Mytilus edulis]|uniref:G-protein coupled receptors family 1 profile domain-containing protein n=1 Tax=Mytilus edulis TaxID=6550 RepID=A0A8S3RK34_MYTED|nr:unnamed protein product [Mytilus edulis]
MSVQQNFTEFDNDTYCANNCNNTNSMLFVVVLYVFGSLTVACNVPSLLIVMVAFLRRLEMKGIHMMSLSLTDALLGVSWMMLTSTLGGRKLSFVDCASISYMLCVTFFASMFQVLGICIERNMVICLNSKLVIKHKRKVSMCITMISWGLAIVSSATVSAVYAGSYHDARTCSLDSLFQDQIKQQLEHSEYFLPLFKLQWYLP